MVFRPHPTSHPMPAFLKTAKRTHKHPLHSPPPCQASDCASQGSFGKDENVRSFLFTVTTVGAGRRNQDLHIRGKEGQVKPFKAGLGAATWLPRCI